MTTQEIEIELLPGLHGVSASDWDACACPEAADGGRPSDPFTTYRFLKALEDSGSVGAGTGWQPQYLAARVDGQIIAVAPMYAKSHSQGEYIFDHSWAHAYERAGGRYYPKLQMAVPFTPATGRRFLTRPGFEDLGLQALVQGAVQLAEKNGIIGCTSLSARPMRPSAARDWGSCTATSQQFHWLNRDYDDFDAFLASLSSRKRKNIRKERRQAQEFGGDDPHALRRRSETRTLGCVLGVLPGHRRAKMGHAVPDAQVLRHGSGDAARRHGAGSRGP